MVTLNSAILATCLLLLPLVTCDPISITENRGDKDIDNYKPAFGKSPDIPYNKDLNFKSEDAGSVVNKEPVGHNGVHNAAGEPKKSHTVRIIDAIECAEDVKRFCSDTARNNNFLLLDCLQDDQRTDEKLSNSCHHFLWNYKQNLTLDLRFDKASHEACGNEFIKIKECSELELGRGQVIPCLVEHYDEITSKSCTNFVNKMASIIFSDYRFMGRFISDCNNDISKFTCGRMGSPEADGSPHSQGRVVSCLTDHKKLLDKKCNKALLHVAELQADDYHLDRPLFYACRDDREALCSDVVAGNGAIFKCLYQHLGEKSLSEPCRVRLETRQQLISEDVKVNKVFYDACSQDIKENKCFQNVSPDTQDDLSRSTVLLCLEKAQNDGKSIQATCLQEMFESRSVLMQDYKISPELVDACMEEIRSQCNGLGPGGETIDCLMNQAMKKRNDNTHKFSDTCRVQIKNLLDLVNPGEDIRLDQPLLRSCGDVITAACGDRSKGHGDVMTCLLENLDHEEMTDDCEEHLLVMQYFAIRDFKLDHHLFKHCRKDAKKLCNAGEFENPHNMTPDQGPIIFSCLFRHIKSPDDPKPSRACIHEVRRVMKERSTRIELHPEVEEDCMAELSDLCSDDDEHLERGAEMECLQMNLEDLQPACKAKVSAFTEDEADDIEIDRHLMKACTPMIKHFCNDYLDNGAVSEDVLECLIKHKAHHDMDEKCAVGIEHHQLISMKDFKFNKKFHEACKFSVSKYCSKNTKYDVVACLSEHVRNDTLKEVEHHRIEKKCRRQLRFELLQRDESFNLDPELEAVCKLDKEKFCAHKTAGEAEIIECLKAHKRKLQDVCHKVIFKREQEEAVFGDWNLLNTCKAMMTEYGCSVDDGEDSVLKCLKRHKEDDNFDNTCRKLVQKRIVENTRDYRLNPDLQKACRLDIPKFCSLVFLGKGKDMEMDGLVINCLKKKYASKPKILSRDCERAIKSQIIDAALDINLNPVLMNICKNDISHFCMDEVSNVEENDDLETYKANTEGAVMECLKKHFQQLTSEECKKEVAFVIRESRIDINVDPLLHSTCQEDLIVLCKSVQQGQGQLMSCLLANLESDADSLTRNCKQMLQARKDLWEYAAQVAPPETLNDVAEQVLMSPSRNYFMAVIFLCVGIIFIIGLTCGRVTKRIRAELKNK